MTYLRFIILIGLVSLFGDMVYEGGRSVFGAYLATLGISAVFLGAIVGFGEFISYAFRLIFGKIADKTKNYWFFTFLGYALIFSIPLIAFSPLPIIAFLFVLERLGKAIRTPARDALISFTKTGVGKGFGIHEAIDQVGAVFGPLLVFSALHFGLGYRESFAILFIPAVAMIFTLYFAKASHVLEESFEVEEKIGKNFWYYMFFSALSFSGIANFQLIAYHFEKNAIFADELIAVLYAIAMLFSAIFALLAGISYDKLGLKNLFVVSFLAPISLILAFSSNPVMGVILLGIILGIQESSMRAGVAKFAEKSERATAYGIFNLFTGLGYFFGAAVLGFLYTVSFDYMIAFSVITEFLALIFLLRVLKV
ncbi:MAG: MFS transporter [Archaeoglobaceae archaeon]